MRVSYFLPLLIRKRRLTAFEYCPGSGVNEILVEKYPI